MIEIKCGDGKIVIGEPCPPVQSFIFPLTKGDPNNKEEGEENDSTQPS